jgi:hypothetical protein
LALLGFLAVAAFLFLAGYTDHAIAALPFLLILACPLMHLFMMHCSHGTHGGHGEQPQLPADERRREEP